MLQNEKKKKQEEEEKKYPICRELLLFEIFNTTFLSVIHLFNVNFFFLFLHSVFIFSIVIRLKLRKFTAAKCSAKPRKLHWANIMFESLPLLQLTFAKLYSSVVAPEKFHGGRRKLLFEVVDELQKTKKKKKNYICLWSRLHHRMCFQATSFPRAPNKKHPKQMKRRKKKPTVFYLRFR